VLLLSHQAAFEVTSVALNFAWDHPDLLEGQAQERLPKMLHELSIFSE